MLLHKGIKVLSGFAKLSVVNSNSHLTYLFTGDMPNLKRIDSGIIPRSISFEKLRLSGIMFVACMAASSIAALSVESKRYLKLCDY